MSIIAKCRFIVMTRWLLFNAISEYHKMLFHDKMHTYASSMIYVIRDFAMFIKRPSCTGKLVYLLTFFYTKRRKKLCRST